MATAARLYTEGAASGAIAAVVGEDDPLTRRVAGVLSKHRYNVVYHRSATDFLAGLSTERESGTSNDSESDAPALYILNYRVKQARGMGHRMLVDALKALNHVSPRTPVLVTIDEQGQKIIKVAISAGADEILSAGDAEIDELVWTRVQSALAKAEAAPSISAPDREAAAGMPAGGVERRRTLRRRTDRRAAPGRAPAASAWPGDVEEVWEAPASADEASAARERVRAAVQRLPSTEERRGPLADVLGISAPGLRSENGRLDAKKIAKQLGVSLAGLAKITPISRQALNETPDSAHAQVALDPLARSLDVLGTALPREHVGAWLNAPHPRLEGETPIHAILQGRGEQVARMLERARDGGVD